MSRSNYKYIPMYNDDLKNYFLIFTEQKSKKVTKINRKKLINFWTYNSTYLFYSGKFWRTLKPTIYSFNLKFGMFSKTRKPFFFRSKKKR